MPYVPRSEHFKPGGVGNLTYELAYIVGEYLEARTNEEKPCPPYQAYAETLGALEAVKHEIYRRLVVPHEDAAIIRNGDVTPLAKLELAEQDAREEAYRQAEAERLASFGPNVAKVYPSEPVEEQGTLFPLEEVPETDASSDYEWRDGTD